MEFDLSKEQLLLQQSLREFTKREIEPLAAQIDSQGTLPDGLLKKMAGINLPGMIFPPEYGGSGAGSLSCILAIEQISYSGTGAWWLAAFTNSIPECIVRFGTDDQKKKYLKPVCEGNAYPSIQFTEENTGSDPEALITTAIPDGNHYVINGMKRFSTFGSRPGYAILYAKDETDKCSAFIVEKNAKGYSTGKNYDLTGGGGIETADVFLENVMVPEENLLGVKGNGVSILFHWIAYEKIQQCAACLGIAQAALDEARAYAKSRIVKGKPMAKLLSIRSTLAEMYSHLQAARWLTYRTAYLKDSDAPGWMTEAAAAKLFVVPAVMEIVEKARQIHGAYGYTKEFKIERLNRAIAGASVIAVGLEINRSIVSASLIK
ncbi:MAG: acyl-CoA dehydrogenase family protein [Deltaproteobacteria bacterium]|nr:acyl-CoA dehydrogenase family protein [Deltaproteobacteria bacterium]